MPYEEIRLKGAEYKYQFQDNLYANKQMVQIAVNDIEQNYDNSKYVIVDVRTAQEFSGEETNFNNRAGTIPFSINIPSKSIPTRLFNTTATSIYHQDQEIPKDKEIIVFCGSGWRASIGTFVFNQTGYNVKLYDKSYNEWGKLKTISNFEFFKE